MAYTERQSVDYAGPLRTVLVAGLGGAAVDAVYFSSKALVMGQSPISVLQAIAAFWLGKDAFGGGPQSAALGAATHIALATMMAGGLWLARPHVRWLNGSVVQAGVVYGLFLYVLMYLVVLPIRWPTLYPSFNGFGSILDIAAHLAVGITIALLLKGTDRPKQADPTP
jgi:hypothetical protein